MHFLSPLPKMGCQKCHVPILAPLLNCEVTLNKLLALLALWNQGVVVLVISQATGLSLFLPQPNNQGLSFVAGEELSSIPQPLLG